MISAMAVWAIDTPAWIIFILIPMITIVIKPFWIKITINVTTTFLFGMIMALNHANLFIVQIFHRLISTNDIHHAFESSFVTGSVLPELLSLNAILLVILPTIFYGLIGYILCQKSKYIKQHSQRNIVIIIFLLLIFGELMHKVGYSVPLVRPNYAGTMSLYWHSLFKKVKSISPITTEEFKTIRKERALLKSQVSSYSNLPVPPTKHPSIIIIILESFTDIFTNDSINNEPITPNLARIGKEGRRYTRFYSNSYVTSRAIWSMLTGEIDLISKIIFYNYPLTQVPFITDILVDNGYQCAFFHGNTADFDNRRDVLSRHGFSSIIDRDDFMSISDTVEWGPYKGIGWGINDINFMTRSVNKLDSLMRQERPLLGILLTLSNHHPYIVPKKYRVFNSKTPGNFNHEMFNSMHYSDKALGIFWNEIKSKPWFNNTYFIITGDNGLFPENKLSSREVEVPSYFKVPCIVVGPNITKSEDTRLSSHIDLAATISSIAGLSDNFGLGHSIFTTHNRYVPICGTFFNTILITHQSIMFGNTNGISEYIYNKPDKQSVNLFNTLTSYQNLWGRAVGSGQDLSQLLTPDHNIDITNKIRY